jgi:hypothetical protein
MATALSVELWSPPPRPAERHISVDPYELKVAIKNRLELCDRGMYDDLTKLMEGVANFDFYDLKQRYVCLLRGGLGVLSVSRNA